MLISLIGLQFLLVVHHNTLILISFTYVFLRFSCIIVSLLLQHRIVIRPCHARQMRFLVWFVVGGNFKGFSCMADHIGFIALFTPLETL